MNVYVAETKINRGREQKRDEQSESNIFCLFVFTFTFFGFVLSCFRLLFHSVYLCSFDLRAFLL